MNTFRKHTQNCKLFFNAAIRKELVGSNPFNRVKSGSVQTSDRDYFLKAEDAQRVIDAAPDANWRLIIALCRYGGLRCPSEVVECRWDDVLWDQHKLLVHSTKTARHDGKGTRFIPLFPELMPYIEESFNEAPEGATKMIPGKDANSNLRTTMTKIIQKAGMAPWPKLFQNMRSTRETELLRSKKWAPHVIAAWFGHSVRVQAKHYTQEVEDDFAEASQVVTVAVTESTDRVEQLESELAKMREKLDSLGIQSG